MNTTKPDIFDRKVNPFLKFAFFLLLAAGVASLAAGGCSRPRPGETVPLLLASPATFTFSSAAPAEATVALEGGPAVRVLVAEGLTRLPVPAGRITVIAPWGVSWHCRQSVDDVRALDALWAK